MLFRSYGVGFRGGWSAATFLENTAFANAGASFLSPGVRNAFAAQVDAQGQPSDVSNNPRVGFQPKPFGIGRVNGLAAGALVPQDSILRFQVDVSDAEIEDAETVTLTLLPGAGYTLMASQPSSATGFILDQDQPTVTVSVADTTSTLITAGTETSTGTALRFIVSREVATTSPLVVNYTMSGTATEGVDYTGTTGSVTIDSSATSAYITITAVNDTIPEGVESIIMNLTPAPGTYGLLVSSATMLLGDNDVFASGSVGFLAASSSTLENSGTFNVPVRVITGTPTNDITVNYRVSGGTATGGGVDYTLASGTLTFNPGATTQNIAVTIINDTLDEADETIQITLSNPINATLGANTVHTYTINDDDPPPSVAFEIGRAHV